MRYTEYEDDMPSDNVHPPSSWVSWYVWWVSEWYKISEFATVNTNHSHCALGSTQCDPCIHTSNYQVASHITTPSIGSMYGYSDVDSMTESYIIFHMLRDSVVFAYVYLYSIEYVHSYTAAQKFPFGQPMKICQRELTKHDWHQTTESQWCYMGMHYWKYNIWASFPLKCVFVN